MVGFRSFSISVSPVNTVINGDFEMGNTTGWILGGGDRANIDSSNIQAHNYLPGGIMYSSTIANTRSSIVTGILDPILSNLMPIPVRNGSYALRVGDTIGGTYVSVTTQTASNYTFPSIYFAWLAVMQMSGHTAATNSLLLIELKDVTTGTLLLQRRFDSDAVLSADTARFTNNSTYFYTPSWQVENVSITSSRQGHSFSLTVIATDCGGAAHLSYMYIDDFGPNAL